MLQSVSMRSLASVRSNEVAEANKPLRAIVKQVAGRFLWSTILVSFGCSKMVPSLCENGILQAVRSPDGTYEAVLFVRNCGTTVATSTQISIVPAGTAIHDTGNVLIVDSGNGAAPTNDDGSIGVRIDWMDRREVAIDYAGTARVFKKVEQLGDIGIHYAGLHRRAVTGWPQGH